MNPIDGAYQITNLVQVVEVNWVLLKSYYRLPTLISLLFFLHSLPPCSLLSFFSCLVSEEWGLWQADSDLGKMTSN